MHQKLQQAIVATRAGKIVEAQQLLIQVLQDDPQEPNAWFLLGHLADKEERQIAYLKKTVALDPNHAKAKQRLMQLGAIPVPPPIVTQSVAAPQTKTPHAMAQDTKTKNVTEEPATAVPHMPTPPPAQEKESSPTAQIDHDWHKRAGTPKRTQPPTSPAKSATAVAQTTPEETKPSSPPKKRNVWLIILLVFIIFSLLGIVAYWLYLYMTSSL